MSTFQAIGRIARKSSLHTLLDRSFGERWALPRKMIEALPSIATGRLLRPTVKREKVFCGKFCRSRFGTGPNHSACLLRHPIESIKSLEGNSVPNNEAITVAIIVHYREYISTMCSAGVQCFDLKRTTLSHRYHVYIGYNKEDTSRKGNVTETHHTWFARKVAESISS